MAGVIKGTTAQTPQATKLEVLVDAAGRLYTALASTTGGVVDIAAAGASFAATTIAMATNSFQYLWDASTGTWIRQVSDASGQAQIAGYTAGTTSNRIEEIDPLSEQHAEETLIDETNITANTTAYEYLDMDGYRYLSLQGQTSGATPTDVLTVTVEATNQDDGTAQDACAYQDVTNALFGVASWVNTNFFGVMSTPGAFKYIRVKYVTSNTGGNDADLIVYAKRMW